LETRLFAPGRLRRKKNHGDKSEKHQERLFTRFLEWIARGTAAGGGPGHAACAT